MTLHPYELQDIDNDCVGAREPDWPVPLPSADRKHTTVHLVQWSAYGLETYGLVPLLTQEIDNDCIDACETDWLVRAEGKGVHLALPLLS